MRAKSVFTLSLLASLFSFGHADARPQPAVRPAVPAWLALRIQHQFATEEEIAFHRALIEGRSTEPYTRLADDTTVCPGCQSNSLCPQNCTGGCQSTDTSGCKQGTSCLSTCLQSTQDDSSGG